MPTLVIHTSHSQVKENQKQDFTRTVETGRGEGYAISNNLFQQLAPGDDVIVICKAHRKQAVGQIKEFIPMEKAGNGLQRYDIIMVNLKSVPFAQEDIKLNRNGVTVI